MYFKRLNLYVKSITYLDIPELFAAITAPSAVKEVSCPQDKATGVLDNRALAVINAPNGGFDLLDTSLDILVYLKMLDSFIMMI